MLKDIPFFGKDHEDMLYHIDEVKDIANYFNVPNVSREAVLIRMLLVTFIGDAKFWLKSLAPGAITTWTNIREALLSSLVHHQNYPSSRKRYQISNKMMVNRC